ncbi:MAG TPA: methyltransferase domain-containing protein [Polyangiaceae bacterium]
MPGGAGFLRLENGQGAFVSGALPGERIAVEQAEDHRSYLNATRWQLLTASPDRVTPVCPVQSSCGGCDWMMLSYPAQLAAKLGMLREALTRTGHFSELPEIRFVASERELGYRSRIRLHVDAAGRLGFFAENSQTLVEIPGCKVADPELDRALVTLREIAARFPRAIVQFAEFELRVAPAGPRLSLWLAPKAEKLAGTAEFLGALGASFHVAVGTEPSDPERDQRFDLPNGVELGVPAHAFTQVNWPINRAIVSALLAGAERRGARKFLDLYCGAGNFSLPLLAQSLSGVSVEAARASIAAAERAARAAKLEGARFIAGDVRAALAQLPQSEGFDLVVLDPPRSGAREILPELARRGARHIAYCACDPVTLARDLRTLCDFGYALAEITGYDMFPHTHHFETLVWLEKS